MVAFSFVLCIDCRAMGDIGRQLRVDQRQGRIGRGSRGLRRGADRHRGNGAAGCNGQ
jgi:hypothetical protein